MKNTTRSTSEQPPHNKQATFSTTARPVGADGRAANLAGDSTSARRLRTKLLALCLFALPVMAADVYDFSVPAPVTISSPAGVQSGWGYSLTNESSALWLVTTGLSTGSFQYAVPSSIFDFPDLAPGAMVDVLYDPVTPAGLFQINWDANAPPGFVSSGNFTLSAQWWSGDPLHGGSLISTAPVVTVPYSVGLNPIPEPTTAGLAGLVFLPFLLFLRRRHVRAA